MATRFLETTKNDNCHSDNKNKSRDDNKIKKRYKRDKQKKNTTAITYHTPEHSR